MTHPPGAVFDAAARGELPPDDWRTEVVAAPPADRLRGATVGMTGHVVLVAGFVPAGAEVLFVA